jgi:hypothetical protein
LEQQHSAAVLPLFNGTHYLPATASSTTSLKPIASAMVAKPAAKAFTQPLVSVDAAVTKRVDKWAIDRRKRIEPPSLIDVALSDIQAKVSANRACVSFLQGYSSPTERGVLKKHLSLIEKNGQWFITEESIADQLVRGNSNRRSKT